MRSPATFENQNERKQEKALRAEVANSGEVLTYADRECSGIRNGKIVFREAEPFKVFARTKTAFQTDSPNMDLANFITSSEELSIEDEIKNGLGSVYNFNDLYFELNSKEEIAFEVDGNQTVSYGQKFLAKADNVQKVDLLFSVLVCFEVPK